MSQIACLNVRFLVADKNRAQKNLIVVVPVLQCPEIDSHALLEQKLRSMDEADCSVIGTQAAEKNYSRLDGPFIECMRRIDSKTSSVPTGDRTRI